MDDSLRDLILKAIDQSISSEEFERLQDAIEQSEEVRREYLAAVHLTEALTGIACEAPTEGTMSLGESARGISKEGKRARLGSTLRVSFRQMAMAAALLVCVSCLAFWIGRRNPPESPENLGREGKQVELLIAGHATLRRAVDLQWSPGATSFRKGDVLPDGVLSFDKGIAEIDFFCGASAIVEGPAILDVESDWSVRVVKGRMRVNVPPAARGFVVKAADSEIIDLGTEFALEVGADNGRVEVLDGEVAFRGGVHDGNHLVTGERLWLKDTGAQPDALVGLSTAVDVQRRGQEAEALRFSQWEKHSLGLRVDTRLIAYYPMLKLDDESERVVPNVAPSGSILDGHMVGRVQRTSGRFGSESLGLDFSRPGARVRTRIDGEFGAFTFAAWVRIENLDHMYNALFMSDGYENGEPHWQIRDDGRLMFSVMVDDSRDVRVPNRFDQRVVQDAGWHRVYHTDPIWDASKSGRWLHLAAVYDPVGRRVEQYVNGEQVASEEISDEFHISALRIGPAEIGNWGQPFRKTPWFAVRNLNGTIDEMLILNAALSGEAIESLYQQGKPLGY